MTDDDGGDFLGQLVPHTIYNPPLVHDRQGLFRRSTFGIPLQHASQYQYQYQHQYQHQCQCQFSAASQSSSIPSPISFWDWVRAVSLSLSPSSVCFSIRSFIGSFPLSFSSLRLSFFVVPRSTSED